MPCRRRCCGPGANLSSFQGRSSLRSWLYTIATNVCLRAIERRPSRVLPIDYGPSADPHEPLREPLLESVWIEPYPDERLDLDDGLAGPEARYEQRESIELAFIAALQHLPARQRAVLILRDVLGFSGAEVAEALETTPASVYSALQRAHATLDERRPDRSQQATLRSLGDEQQRAIVNRYVEAWSGNDVDTIVGMLTETATLAMPPIPSWYRGRDAIERVLRDLVFDGSEALADVAHRRQWSAGGRHLRARQLGRLRPSRRDRPDVERRPDRRDDALPRSVDGRAVRSTCPGLTP